MAKRYWVRGLWIGALIGISLFIIALILEFNAIHSSILSYIDGAWIVNHIPSGMAGEGGDMGWHSTFGFYNNLPLRGILCGLSSIIQFSILGLLIGGIFKKKR